MNVKPIGRGLALLFCVSGGGCSTQATVDGPGRHPGQVSPSLVMPGMVAWRAEPGAWEYRRNDARLNAGQAPTRQWHEWAEIRNRDRTRTTNGRPREFSTTFVRTYSLRQVN